MTNATLFLIIVPVIAILLLVINLILAQHNPYQEKENPFECGYLSFSGQNRTQFTISFFIFALLFLLFDLEIVLVYPYCVSGYSNDSYGLTIVMIFMAVLTVGFAFEIGKRALKIVSKQTLLPNNEDLQTKYIFFNMKKSAPNWNLLAYVKLLVKL